MRHMWVMTLLLGSIALPVQAAGPVSSSARDGNSGANSFFSELDPGGLVSSELTNLSQKWPDDFHRYADQFCQLRDLCGQAAQTYWNDKARDQSRVGLHPVSTRGEVEYRASMRKKLPSYMKKRLAELRGAVAMEYQLNHCPLLSPISLAQQAAYGSFKEAVNMLDDDVSHYRYTACRDKINFAIGPRCDQLDKQHAEKAISANRGNLLKAPKGQKPKEKSKNEIAQRREQQ